MPRGILYRALLIIVLTLWAVLYLVPSLMTTSPEWWPSFLPSRKIRRRKMRRQNRPLSRRRLSSITGTMSGGS